jgi:hypothetical protein
MLRTFGGTGAGKKQPSLKGQRVLGEASVTKGKLYASPAWMPPSERANLLDSFGS